MNMGKGILISSLLIWIEALTGCVNEAPPALPKELTLGDSTLSNSFTVSVGGGKFYSTTGDTSKALRITFPPKSYTVSKTVTATTTIIKSSTFGNNITPITPLYTIDAGTDFSNKDIIIDIPVALDTNNFSMAFFYDLTTHELEGIPTIGLTQDNPKKFSITFRRSGSFFVSSIAKSKLAASISSSFDPKQDNWEFPNYATLITPSGQFAGQTLSAMWYYYEQALKGKPLLYGQFDIDHGGESPKIWQDNDLGLRVAAETQRELQWNSYSFNMIGPLNNGNILLTADQIIYAMMVTGKPQFITVIKDSTVLPLIAYNVSDGKLYISDPNYPTSESQTISVRANPNVYNTGVSMYDIGAHGTSRFTGATYIGVRAMVDWDAITKIWADAQNNIFASFPPYSVTFSDASGNLKPRTNGFLTLRDTVTYKVTGNPSKVWVYQNNIFSTFTTSNTISLKPGANPINMYFQNQSPDNTHSVWNGFSSVNIQKQTFSILPAIDSSFVENDVILHAVMAQKPSSSLRYEWDMGDGSTVIKNINIDSIKYRYKKTGTFTVTLSIYQVSSNTLIGKEITTVVVSLNPVLISPINGITSIPYIFYGYINVPKDIIQRCEWSMGDGSPSKSVIGDTIKYTFQNAGSYTILLNIFDNETSLLLGEAKETITVSQGQLPTLAQLQSMKFVKVDFFAHNKYELENLFVDTSNYDDFSTIEIGGGASSDTSSNRIIWNGLSFSTTLSNSTSYNDSKGNWGGMNLQQNVSGTFNNIFSKLNVAASYSYSNSSRAPDISGANTDNQGQDRSIICQDIYLAKNSADSIIFLISGPFIQNLGIQISHGVYSKHDSHGVHYDKQNKYISTYWQDPINIPTVKATFTSSFLNP